MRHNEPGTKGRPAGELPGMGQGDLSRGWLAHTLHQRLQLAAVRDAARGTLEGYCHAHNPTRASMKGQTGEVRTQGAHSTQPHTTLTQHSSTTFCVHAIDAMCALWVAAAGLLPALPTPRTAGKQASDPGCMWRPPPDGFAAAGKAWAP
jgi:hypothetical protein